MPVRHRHGRRQGLPRLELGDAGGPFLPYGSGHSSILANERGLRELFQRNRMRSLPIEEEVAFLRQCAARFNLYARLLTTLREEAGAETGLSATLALPVADETQGDDRMPSEANRASPDENVRLSKPGESRESVL